MLSFLRIFFLLRNLLLKNDTTNVFQDINHINFFDGEYPEIPNDDERVEPKLNSDLRSQSDSNDSFVSSGGVNNVDFPVNNSGNDADSSDDIIATPYEEVAKLEENIFLRDRKAIGSKWIYKIKYWSSGEIDRYKARLVAQGFGQKKGIDYEETFSLVVKMVTVRCLLNVVVSNNWRVFQLDVNNAFLYEDLVETVYMRPREGYFPSGNKVCRLKKFLYGLKQAPRQWNAKLTSTLIENGFNQSKSDYSLYTKSDKGVFLVCLFMWMILSLLYVLDLLSEYGMLACKPAKTPLMSKLVISNEAYDIDPTLDNITDYQKLMSKLIYLTNTRPDISYDVHCLSQFMHSPLQSHLKTTFKILIYLKGYLGLGIHIVKDSVRNKTLSKSSSEAEYRALASVTIEVIWILKFFKDLNIENVLPVTLYCDSNSAIKIAANPVFHERTKHLEIDLHFVREIFLKGVVKRLRLRGDVEIYSLASWYNSSVAY
ncbi:ribonuclease H-like domain-containing protein [Tanacetum coccineum]